MKFGKLLLIGATAFLTFTASAQDDDAKRECDRMRFLAGEGVKANDYKTATVYYHRAEVLCGGFDKANWDRLLGSIKFVINEETDEGVKKLYIDSLLGGWDRQEAAELYEEVYDLERGMYIMQSSTPDAAKADKFFQRGIKAAGLETHEAYIVYAYYATYLMYNATPEGEEKAALKKRMISDYFEYSEMVSKAKMTPLTQESLTTYLDYVVQSCDELLPEIPGYIENLPEDKDLGIEAIQRMMTLLETKGCTDSKEYLALNDAWLVRNPDCIPCLITKTESLSGNEAIKVLRDIMGKTDDPALKAKCQYQIAYTQFKSGSYKAAYASGRACSGEYQSKGMYIAAQSVAATANGCGDSTFERKCNYIYAAQLAEQAGQGGAAANYRAKGPSAQDCFNENSPTSVSLSCWGVTVNPCN